MIHRVGLLVVLVLAGCTHVTYSFHRQLGPHQEGTSRFYFWGLMNRAEVAVGERCPGGVAKVHVHTTFGNGLVSALTLGVYTPRTYEIWCAASSAGSAQASLTIPSQGND